MVIQELSLGQVMENFTQSRIKKSGNAITLRTLGKAPDAYLTQILRSNIARVSLRDLVLKILAAMRLSIVQTRMHSD